MSLKIKHRGNWNTTERYLRSKKNRRIRLILERYGALGVESLRAATPKDTGEAADSWYYEIKDTGTGFTISWNNSKAAGTAPLVVLLQYGHATRNGTWVQGTDFINPALKPTMDKISHDIWKEVKRA